MRPNAGFIQALRVPLALNLQALRTFLAQNQLRLPAMIDMEARHDLAAAAARFGWRRPQKPAGSILLLLGLIAIGGLVLVAVLASGLGEAIMLALLSLLAVAGAFLILGLLSGYLRLSERVAEAEMVKTIADGLDHGLKIVNQQGVVLYRNRALQRLTGRRAGRHATLEELFAGEPDSAQAFFRLNRAAERAEVRDEEFYVHSRPGGGHAGDEPLAQDLTHRGQHPLISDPVSAQPVHHGGPLAVGVAGGHASSIRLRRVAAARCR
jgi:PAS domain-containing protein